MGYFERAVISNGYFEGAVTSKIPTKVLGFHNIQHDILLIRFTLIWKTAKSSDITIRSSRHNIMQEKN
jgi:hypothetical protein